MTIPSHTTTDVPRLRPGQQWRDVGMQPDTAANLVTIDRVEDGRTVHGSYRAAGTLAIGAGVWSVDDFSRFALVVDPEWPTFKIAASIAFNDDRVSAVSRTVRGGRAEPVDRLQSACRFDS